MPPGKVTLRLLVGFPLVWMIVMLVITNKQNKALARERAKAQEEERQNKIMAQLKADLEIQVKERTAELTQQKEELQLTVNELKATQTQLIHSEKMASLGELTAGIAHEIQNPLNFVNNFLKSNQELIDELKEAVSNNDQEEITAILEDISENERKSDAPWKACGANCKKACFSIHGRDRMKKYQRILMPS